MKIEVCKNRIFDRLQILLLINTYYIMENNNERDLFEYYDELPQEVREILSFYELEEMDYNTCENLLKKLNTVGYTFDYGLSAEPFNLKKILP